MRKTTITICVFMLVACFATLAVADSATREEVMLKCKQAGQLIADKGIEAAVKEIGNKKGHFVWKDSYVFVMDLDGKMLAHPFKPELTQQETVINISDPDGKPLFVEFIKIANAKGEGWVDYRWPRPGQDTPTEKSSFIYRVPGTPYFVGAGIYK
jgi:cytochrome c